MSEVERLGRIRAHLRRMLEGAVDDVRPTTYGAALVTPSLPLVWALSVVRVDDPAADAEALEREAEQALAGFGHRKLVVYDSEHGRCLAPALVARGWNATRLLLMARRREADRAPTGGAGGSVTREAGAAVLAAFRREQPFGSHEEAVRQLAAMDDRFARVAWARDFGAPVEAPASTCRLYVDGGLAQIDEVGTLGSQRRRGHARAAVLAAAEAGAAAGCDLVFLATDADDWPQELYRRLGFDAIGSIYEFLKLSLTTPRP